MLTGEVILMEAIMRPTEEEKGFVGTLRPAPRYPF